MIKIVNVGRKPIMFNTETEEIKGLASEVRSIDDIYIVPEDATLRWENKFKDSVDDIKVNKNDIIVTFYNSDLKTDYVIVKSEDWLDAMKNYKEIIQKRKEEWAAEKANLTPVNDDCTECCKCSN